MIIPPPARVLLIGMALVVLCALAVADASAEGAALPRLPSIVFVLADDLGFGDLGCYGQKKIRTPNLDRLAAEGMRFTQHYAGSAVCAPSRCVLHTGRHPGHAAIRDNREVNPEGQAPLSAGVVTIAARLRQGGYATGAFGKWGLGAPGSTGEPLRQGFDRFFGYNCQRQAHNYYPTSLWDNAARLPLNNPPFAAHQKLPAGADSGDAGSYTAFSGSDYAPDLMVDQALRFIRVHHDQPFLLYFPTPLPHLALQVPADSLAEYLSAFPDVPYRGTSGYLPHRTPRAAYAAMISRLDRDVGRLLALLDELGIGSHTVVVFTSDNGPLADQLGGTDTDFFGSAGALRGRKGSLYEGGVRVPCLVRWPRHVAAGVTSDRVTGFEDWLSTGRGLLTFQDVGGALAGIAAIWPLEMRGLGMGSNRIRPLSRGFQPCSNTSHEPAHAL